MLTHYVPVKALPFHTFCQMLETLREWWNSTPRFISEPKWESIVGIESTTVLFTLVRFCPSTLRWPHKSYVSYRIFFQFYILTYCSINFSSSRNTVPFFTNADIAYISKHEGRYIHCNIRERGH